MRPSAAIAACIAITFAAICAISLSADDTARAGEGGDIADIRAATARYHDVALALRDGYVPVGPCDEAAGRGAMGSHYLHPGRAADTVVDARRPEVLLYEPQDDGSLRLIGVEYFVADADQDLATDDDRPSLLGHAFDGPMLGHEPGMPVHYDLHAWVWRHNPTGSFSIWNPRVSCP